MLTAEMRVPHHGGSPAEMLRDLADFLDKLDPAMHHARITRGRHAGRTLAGVLRGGRQSRDEVQSDLRWLADQLDAVEEGDSR